MSSPTFIDAPPSPPTIKHHMGKKMKLPFLYRSTSDPTPSPWPLPSCGNIETHSFRATQKSRIIRPVERTISSPTAIPPNTWSTPETSGSISSMSEDSSGGDNQIEDVIRGLKSERLIFEPGESNSILESGARTSCSSSGKSRANIADSSSNVVPYKESVVLSMESRDPYVDFKKSMEEMVEAHALVKNWEGLEELLSWYLRVNGRNNYSYIIGAFVDLLVSLSFDDFLTNTTTTTTTTTNTISSSSSSSSSLLATVSTCSQSPLSPLSYPSSSSLTTTPPCLSSLDQGDDDDDDHVLSSS